MAKKMTTEQRAVDAYIRGAYLEGGSKKAIANSRIDFSAGYIAGHRAGSRLTKAERKVIEAAENWKDAPPHTSLNTCMDLDEAVEEYQSKKVRK